MAVLRTEEITKDFPGCRALDHVSVSFESHKVHALLGKNGSGKSTLVKIFSGALKPTEGRFYLDDRQLGFPEPQQAVKFGMVTVYQEMSIIPSLTVAENIFLGQLPKKRGMVDWKALNKNAKILLESMNVDIKPTTMVRDLSIWQCQIVEIAKAMSKEPKVLMLDEPTSSLAQNEVEQLFQLIREIKKKDVIILYITHKMQEVHQIADTVTVLRDGRLVGTSSISDIDNAGILKMMFGDVAVRSRPADICPEEKTVLEVKELCRGSYFQHINFSLKKGEVLGIAGMLGSGRTELLRSIFGVDRFDSGQIFIKGKQVTGHINPRQMKSEGLALTPEDRKKEGLILLQSTLDNLSMASINKNARGWVVDRKARLADAQKQVEELQIKVSGLNTLASSMSGGNQQKVVVGNWLSNDPSIMMFDEPSRGIDVNAKQQIFEIIWAQARKGISTIFVSTELEELLEVCHRILIMRHGELIGEVRSEDITVEGLYQYCMEGVKR